MELWDTTRQALVLLGTGDPELWQIVGVSLRVSLSALLLITAPAIAAGFVLAHVAFPGRRALVVLVQGLLSLPTVVVGLVLYMLLSRQGPLGDWHLLFTQKAMILGQMMLALPVLTAYTVTAVQGADARVFETAVSLGAGGFRAALSTLWEVRFGVMAAVFTGFGRIISEIGCSLMVGGNIAGLTRNMPTAIALETSKGQFAQGVALGIVLLILALGVNVALAALQGQGGMRKAWQP
ncbi:MAG TPA: ABC transporter permease [Burkholderiales bacterium]|nr:ABC transporter permease [Burkholderiales bacterium]